MYSYIARRLVFGALTIIGVSVMVFVVMRILPGDPLVAIFGPEGMTKLTEEQRASYMSELGLSDRCGCNTPTGCATSRTAISAAPSFAPKASPT